MLRLSVQAVVCHRQDITIGEAAYCFPFTMGTNMIRFKTHVLKRYSLVNYIIHSSQLLNINQHLSKSWLFEAIETSRLVWCFHVFDTLLLSAICWERKTPYSSCIIQMFWTWELHFKIDLYILHYASCSFTWSLNVFFFLMKPSDLKHPINIVCFHFTVCLAILNLYFHRIENDDEAPGECF